MLFNNLQTKEINVKGNERTKGNVKKVCFVWKQTGSYLHIKLDDS